MAKYPRRSVSVTISRELGEEKVSNNFPEIKLREKALEFETTIKGRGVIPNF
jgi:hypothetical protein